MKIYKLSERALAQYRVNTRGNAKIKRYAAQLKLSRNIELGRVVSEDETYVNIQYGYLHIRVRKDADVIVSAHQEYLYPPYEPDVDKYEQINAQYNIR